MSAVEPVSRRTKALIGGAVALTGSLAVAAVDNVFTVGEVVVALAAGVAALGAAYGVSRTGEVADEERGDHEAEGP